MKHPEDGGRALSQGMQVASNSWKRWKHSPLDPPQGAQPCQRLDFRASDLPNWKIINLRRFKQLHLWSLVTAGAENEYSDCLPHSSPWMSDNLKLDVSQVDSWSSPQTCCNTHLQPVATPSFRRLKTPQSPPRLLSHTMSLSLKTTLIPPSKYNISRPGPFLRTATRLFPLERGNSLLLPALVYSQHSRRGNPLKSQSG